MYIESIHINSFGNTDDITYEFSNGVNIIEGDNESGKTTIASFIKFVFYGLSNKSIDTILSERTLYISWNTGIASGTLNLYYNDKHYTIERDLISVKDNFKETVQIIDLETNTQCFKGLSPSEAFLGVPEDVFNHTAYVRQVDSSKVDGSNIGDAIENILFSADETVNTQKAMKKLDDARVYLYYKNKKGGKIFELESELADLQLKLDVAKKANGEIILKESSLHDLKRKQFENDTRLEHLNEQIQNYESYSLVRQYDNINDIKNTTLNLQKQLSKVCDEYSYDDFLPDDNFIRELSSLSNEIEFIQKACVDLEDELKESENIISNVDESNQRIQQIKSLGGKDAIIDKIEEFRHKKNFMKICGSVFAGLSAIVTIATVLIMFFNVMAGTFTLIGALAFALSATMCFLSNKKHKKAIDDLFEECNVNDENELSEIVEEALAAEKHIYIHRENIDNLHQKYNKQTDYYDLKLARANSILLQWGKNIPDDADDVVKCIQDIASEAEAARKLIDDLRRELEKYSTAYLSLAAQIKNYDETELRKNFTPEPNISVEDVNITSLKREYDFINKANLSLTDKIHEMEKQLSSMTSIAEDPLRIYDRILIVINMIEDYTKRHDAYQLAIDMMNKATAGLRDSVSPKLSEYASRLLTVVTDGKYKTLGINSDLEMSYHDGKVTHEVGALSKGTQDLAYVSLRLALINLLYRKSTPPIIFDESFARLDDRRMTNMLKLLSNIADGEIQTFILTSQKREANLMDSVNGYNFIRIE